jgi:metal-responsive CopG/Arc/MetJ family transcriptional regulator
VPAKPVQISIDRELLRRIDADPETRRAGRSAFIRSAVRLYLQAKERRAIDRAILRAYQGKADELLDDVESLMLAQAWPEK